MNRKIILIDLLILAFISILSLQNILFSSGMVFHGDLVFPTSQQQIFDQVYRYSYVWDAYPTLGRDNIISLQLAGFWVISAIMAIVFSPELIEKIWLISIPLLSSCSMYYLTRKVCKCGRLVGLISALIYTYNPFVVDRILSGHLNLLLGYSLTPLIFTLFLFAMERFSIQRAILTGLVFSLLMSLIGYPHQALLLLILMIAYTLYHSSPWKRGRLISTLKNFRVLVIILIMILPFLLVTIGEFTFGTTRLDFSIEEINYFSRYSSFLNVTRLSGYGLGFAEDAALNYPLLSQIMNPTILWLTSGYLIALISFITPIFLRRDKETIFWALVALVSLIFAQGTHGSFESFSFWLYYNVPGFLAFRDPTKFLAITSFSYSILIGFGLKSLIPIIKERLPKNLGKQSKMFVIVTVIILILVTPMMPISYGNFGGLRTIQTPEYYDSVNTWLSDQSDDFRVLWIPPWFPVVSYNWTNAYAIDPILFYTSGRPILSHSDKIMPSNSFQNFLYNVMVKGSTNRLGQILSLANVRYTLVRMDQKTDDWTYFLESLQNQSDISYLRDDAPISIYENQNVGANFFATSKSMFVVGGMDSLVSLSYLSDTVLRDWLVIFGYQMDIEELQHQIDLSSLIVFKDSEISDLSLILLPKKYRIDTNPYAAQSISVNSTWVRSGWSWVPDSIGYNVFLIDDLRFYLSEFSLEGDFVFTRANATLSIPFSTDVSGIFDIWIRVFYRNDAGSLTVLIDDLNMTSQGPATIEPKTQEGIYGSYSGFKWIKLTTQPIFLGKGSHNLKIINENGLSAIDDIVVAPPSEIEKAFETVTDLFKEKEFIYLIEAEKTFSSIEDEWNVYPYYTPEASMGGVIMTYDPRLEDCLCNRPLSVSKKLYIPNDGDYALSLRVCGGEREIDSYIRLHLDDELIFNLSSIPKNFTLIDVDLRNLAKGEHELIIKGFGEVILDQLVLYRLPDDEEQNLYSILSVDSLPNVTFKMINPACYIINSTNEEPFFLIFSESYNPFWTLTGGEEEIKSVIGYSFINSFYISHNGTYQINVEFTPQKIMYVNYAISLFTIIVGIGYLLFITFQSKLKRQKVDDQSSIKIVN
ncbi:MAG: glycosyltransferase family 39 protein [Candidatus Methylarchaceae archaeon HK02M2]|nr:glycosyltransferase family 39 protein [Candidatus Methylarchaceae archaeon HK02M2]